MGWRRHVTRLWSDIAGFLQTRLNFKPIGQSITPGSEIKQREYETIFAPLGTMRRLVFKHRVTQQVIGQKDGTDRSSTPGESPVRATPRDHNTTPTRETTAADDGAPHEPNRGRKPVPRA